MTLSDESTIEGPRYFDIESMKKVAFEIIQQLSRACVKSPGHGRLFASLACSYVKMHEYTRPDNTPEIIGIFIDGFKMNAVRDVRPAKEMCEDLREKMVDHICRYFILKNYELDTVTRVLAHEKFDKYWQNEYYYCLAALYCVESLTMSTYMQNDLFAKLKCWIWGRNYENHTQRVLDIVKVKPDNWFGLCSSKKIMKSLDTKLFISTEFKRNSRNDQDTYPLVILPKITFENLLSAIEDLLQIFFCTDKKIFYPPVANICLNIAFAMTKSHFDASIDCLRIYIAKLDQDVENSPPSSPYQLMLVKIEEISPLSSVCEFSMYSRLQLAKKFYYQRMRIPNYGDDGCNRWCCGDPDCHAICWITPCYDSCCKTELKVIADVQMYNVIKEIQSFDQNTDSKTKRRAASAVFVETMHYSYGSVGARSCKTCKALTVGCILLYFLTNWILESYWH